MITPPPKDQPALPEFTIEEFERFRQLLQEKCGMFFDENKLAVVRNVIQERMTGLNLIDYNAYYRLLNEPLQSQTGADYDSKQPPTGQNALSREMRRLVEGLAVNETAFFRNREHYRALQEEVLPRLFRRNSKSKLLRIWSAGCSTGQEPYSLAILTLETLKGLGYSQDEWKIEIIATDISEKALRQAYNGRYRSDEMRGLSAEQIRLFFQPLTAHTVATAPLDPSEIYKPGRSQFMRYRQRVAYEVSPNIRNLIKFDFLNLTTPVYPRDKFHDFDLILCENVTIYFTPEVTRKVIDNLHAAMSDGAFLFIGYSETLWQVSDRFKLINTQDTFYYQKPFPNEDPSRYVRREPTTGPLTEEAAQAMRQTIQSRTDELRNRLHNSSERLHKTDPLEVKPAEPILPTDRSKKGSSNLNPNRMPVINTNQSSYHLNKHTANATDRTDSTAPVPAPKIDKDWAAWLAEGQQRMKEHDFEQALTSLDAALAANPNEVSVLITLAELKLKLGDYNRAMDLCLKAITINKLAEQAHLMLAMIYHKEGRIEEAVQEYKNTIYVNLDSVIAYMRLADIYRDTGHQRDALREYKRALNVLQQKSPDEMIEELSVSLLIQACQQNITRLTPRQSR